MSEAQMKVLIADDDADIRRILRLALEERPWQLLEAADGAEALELLLVERPSLVILDVMMPELTGWEVLKYIRSSEVLRQTRVLMLTGIGATLNEATSPLFGADAHLDKPFELDELDARLDALLEGTHG